MSDPIKHECGIAMVRLKRPLSWYMERRGSALWGFHKLFLLMEKQHNRGQDGVGLGCCKLDMPLGKPYVFRVRSAKSDSLAAVFRSQQKDFDKMVRRGRVDPKDAAQVKEKFDFAGELLLGHLRYGTSGDFGTGACHPYLRRSNWPTKTLMVAGNFNMTNTAELNRHLIERGQHPVFETDTQTVLEEIGFHLDQAHDFLYHQIREEGFAGRDIPGEIGRRMDIARVIRKASSVWDGGFTIGGIIGSGDAFVLRDPMGIRPAFWFEDDDVVAVASERVPLMTVFDLEREQVRELPAGHVLVIKRDTGVAVRRYVEPAGETKPCSFEKIYFSRGNDPEIYQQRKALGAGLTGQILDAVNDDMENAVFSFVPNTAEIAYHGVMDALRLHRRRQVRDRIRAAMAEGDLSEELIDDLIMRNWPRGEKIAHKDIKMRTFISQEDGRDQLVSHVYDITYDVVRPDDALVVIDDSIVRGTTLRKSILKILSRTNPREIIFASTAPQIRYPDCYGIDMSQLNRFIAFQAAVDLLKVRGLGSVLREVYERCVEELKKPRGEMVNCVKAIYEPFTPEEISERIAELVRPADVQWKGRVRVLYQTIDNLHKALDGGCGDWYFSGDYPTPGGYAVVNQAFVNYFERREGRPYDTLF